jgi:hypothetical protein
MTLIAAAMLAAEAPVSLPMPPIGYAGIAFGVFLLLGVVAWTYRDVANRHGGKSGSGSHDSHGAGH